MKSPKIAAGVNRIHNITLPNDYAVQPAWFGSDLINKVKDVASDAWDWVKKNRCQIGCGAAQAAAIAGCGVTGLAGPALLACNFAASKAGELCRNEC